MEQATFRRNYIYIVFEDGSGIKTSPADSLNRKDAENYKQLWNNYNGRGAVSAVILASADGNISKAYKFSQRGVNYGKE